METKEKIVRALDESNKETKVSFYDIDKDEHLNYLSFEDFLLDLKETFKNAEKTGEIFKVDFGIWKE